MKVPFLDLKAQYRTIKGEIDRAIEAVVNDTAFASGPYVEKFEQEFASYCGTRYVVGVGSGTDALWLTMLALGIGPGDEVITVPMTFIATAEAISMCGAHPVFVDIEDQTYTMDPGRLEKAITPRTRAIVPVHLFGQTADMAPILEVAANHGLPVVEDACQAHGALYRGKKAGSFGIAGCFSFYPGKNLGAYGEAGAVITDNEDLAQRVRRLRDHGQPKKYVHSEIGWNARMDGIQGAVLSVKLRHLDEWNERRREHAKWYATLLTGVSGVVPPVEARERKHVYHVYAVRVRERDRVLQELGQKGISCGIHYPIPLHLQAAYGPLGLKEGSFPISETCAREFLSLPMYPELTAEAIEYVSEELKRAVA